MAYKFELPKEMVRNLWRIREYCGGPAIVESVRRAVRAYIEEQERRIGTTVEDASEAIERHKETEAMERYEKEKKANQDWRVKLENQIKDRNRRLSRKIYR